MDQNSAWVVGISLVCVAGCFALLRYLDWRRALAQDRRLGDGKVREELWRELTETRAERDLLKRDYDSLRERHSAIVQDLQLQILALQARQGEKRGGTGPLISGPALTGALPQQEQWKLVGLLQNAPWLCANQTTRGQLIAGLPQAFRDLVPRHDSARADLAAMIDTAAAWQTPPDEAPVLVRLLDNAAGLLNGAPQGRDLARWRERVGLGPPPDPPAPT